MFKFFLGLMLACASPFALAANLLIYGDSLSAGYGIARDEAWPSLLAKKLSQARSPYTVINVSISGETTAGGRSRLPAALKQYTPSVIVIELGANDGLRGLPVSEMQNNLSAMIEAAKKSGAKVLLVGMRMPPNYGVDYTRDFQSAYLQLAKQHRVPLVPFLLEGIADKREMFQADGLHPVSAAQPKIMDTVWEKLGPMLTRGR